MRREPSNPARIGRITVIQNTVLERAKGLGIQKIARKVGVGVTVVQRVGIAA
jgi:hypothetical protein